MEKAWLSLVYISKPAGSGESGQVQAVLADSDWKEGIGRESVNGNWADPGTLTWQNQPALYYDANDIENTTASSEAFRFADLGKEVKLDVTSLVRQFIKENPGETVMSIALNISATGNRIRIGGNWRTGQGIYGHLRFELRQQGIRAIQICRRYVTGQSADTSQIRLPFPGMVYLLHRRTAGHSSREGTVSEITEK